MLSCPTVLCICFFHLSDHCQCVALFHVFPLSHAGGLRRLHSWSGCRGVLYYFFYYYVLAPVDLSMEILTVGFLTSASA